MWIKTFQNVKYKIERCSTLQVSLLLRMNKHHGEYQFQHQDKQYSLNIEGKGVSPKGDREKIIEKKDERKVNRSGDQN